jgi:hypothetical protein
MVPCLSVGTGKIWRAGGHISSFTWIGSYFGPGYAAENTAVQYNRRRFTSSYKVKMLVQIRGYGQSSSRAGLEGYHPTGEKFLRCVFEDQNSNCESLPSYALKSLAR